MRVCVIDDVPENATYMARVLADYQPIVFSDPRRARVELTANPVDVLVTDQKMPGLTGIELVRDVRNTSDDFAAIVVSAYTDADDLIDAVNSNVIYKYIVKPFSPSVLRQHVQRAIEHITLQRSHRDLQKRLAMQNAALIEEVRRLGSRPVDPMDVFLGSDPAMDRVRDLAHRYAASDQALLISGDTGTGKELMARAIHALSPRHDGPFLALNCSAFQETMLESELFGHVKGAFTGATGAKKGLLETADGGTLFLDEIAETPLILQAKLLRVLQFGTFFPLGSTRERSVHVRLVSATNKNLRTLVQRGVFREDLFYRINTLHIHMPPLRKRPRDIVPLLYHIADLRGLALPPLTESGVREIESYSFPGNIRELAAIVERAALSVKNASLNVLDGRTIGEAFDRIDIRSAEATVPEGPTGTSASDRMEVHLPRDDELIDLSAVVQEVEMRIIKRVLKQETGNVSRTARRLGLSRQGLKNKLDRDGRG